MNMVYMFYLWCFYILKLAAHDVKSSAVSARAVPSPALFVNGNHLAGHHRKGKNLYGVLGFLSGYRLGQGIGFHSNSHLNMFGKMLNGDLHITYGRYGDPFGHIIAAAHNEYHHVPYYPPYPGYPPVYTPPPPSYHQPHPQPPPPPPSYHHPSTYPPTQPWYPIPLHLLPQYPPVLPMPQHSTGGHNQPPSSHPPSSPLNQQQIVNIHEPLNANDPPQDNYQEVRDINRQQIVNRLPDTSRPPGATMRDGPESYDNSGPLYDESDGDQSSSEKLDERLGSSGPQDQRGMQRVGPFRELFNRISPGPNKLFKAPTSPPDMPVMKDMSRMTTTNPPVMNRKPAGKPKNNGRMKVSVEIDQPGRPSVIIQNQNIHSKPKPPHPMPPPPNTGARPTGAGMPPNRQMPPNVDGENNQNPNGDEDEDEYDEDEGGDNGNVGNGDDNNIGNGNGNASQNVDGSTGDDNSENGGTIVNETTTPMTIATTPTTMPPTTGGIPPTTVRPVYGPPSPDNGIVSITRPSVEVPEYPFKPSYHYVYNNYLPDQHHQQPVKIPEEYVHGKAPWEYVGVGQTPDTEEYGVQQAPFRTYPEYPGPYQRDPFGRGRDHKAI